MYVRRHSAGLVAISLLLALLVFAATAGGTPDTVSSVAGNGQRGFSGDGGPATAAMLAAPQGVAPAQGGFLVADTANHRVRRVDAQGRITTVAGTGLAGFSGDGGAATAARLDRPTAVAALPGGGFLVADSRNGRIRHVSAAGQISTVAGNGLVLDGLLGGDGGFARATHLDSPRSVAAAAGGGFLIADTGHNQIRRVGPNGRIDTVAGTGAAGYAGDGGKARWAQLSSPSDVAPTPDGGLLVADTANHRIRAVSPQGVITTVGGGGWRSPRGVAPLPGGGFVVADTANDRVRRVSPRGQVTTLVGSGLDAPTDVAALGARRVLIADALQNRIRLLQPPAPPPRPGSPGATESLPAPAKPRLGKRFNARLARGIVRVRRPGTRLFVTLTGAASIPVGSVVDAAKGSVRLTVARNSKGATQSGTFSGGAFLVRQRRTRRPVTELRLRGGDFSGCAGKARASARRKRGRARRRLWSRVKGRFRTRGRNGAATVRGTTWLTADTCAGTLVAVRHGLVAVRDFARHRTYLVAAGHRHFSRRKR